MTTWVRCPTKGCRLARCEVVRDVVRVTPVSMVVYDGSQQHRSQVSRGEANEAWAFDMRDELPPVAGALACRCGEFSYPDDLALQVRRAGHAGGVVIAQRGDKGSIIRNTTQEH